MARYAAIAFISISLVTAVLLDYFFWDEATKEVYFLCGNFTPGTSEQEVLRQLDTGEFLRVRRQSSFETERLVVDSLYNLGVHRCTVELDPEHRVVQAVYL